MSDLHAVLESTKNHEHGCHRLAVAKANFDFQQSLEIDDSKVTGRQVLEAAGFRPPEEHLLFQVLNDGALEERRLDESIELGEKEVDRFNRIQERPVVPR